MELSKIADIISELSGIDIKNKSRQRRFIYARCIYYKVVRELTYASTKKIGKAVGKDHATVIHNLKNTFPVIERYEKEYYTLYKHALDVVGAYIVETNYKGEVDDELHQFIASHYVKRNKELVAKVDELKEENARLKNALENDKISEYIKRVPLRTMDHFLIKLDGLTNMVSKL